MKADPQRIAEQHKFCFLCQGKMNWQGGKLLICSKCGYRKYLDPVPCTAAILTNNQGEILLVKRRSQYKNGYWDLPGGFFEFNENAEQSVAREIKEELGINVKNPVYFCSMHDIYTYDNITFPTLGLIYTGHLGNEKLTPADDISGFQFFKPRDLPFDKIAFEGIKRALKEFIKQK